MKKLHALGFEADLIQYDAFDLDAPQKVYDHISEKIQQIRYFNK